ncbi:hypothetical protein HMPREF1446_00724, partial [Helicobacter pylori HP250BFiV]
FFFCHFEKILEFFCFWRFLFRLVVLESCKIMVGIHFLHLKFIFLR